MSIVPHIVSELAARLGDRILDERAIADEVGRAHDDHWLAPCAWTTIERTLLSLRRRRIRQHIDRLNARHVEDGLRPLFAPLRLAEASA